MRANIPENVVGRPIADFVDDDFGELLSHGLDVFADEDEAIPLKIQTLPGEFIDMNMIVSRLAHPDAPGYMVECSDITEFIRNAESARMREQRIAGILKTVNESIITSNELGVIEAFNPAAEKLFDYALYEVLGKNVSMLMPEPHKNQHDQYIINYLKSGEPKILGSPKEFEGCRKDGSTFPIEITITELLERKDNRDSKSFTAIIRDISERKRQQEHINFLAHHDSLTGLPNRILFGDRLEHSLELARRKKGSVALLYIDLDNFKPVNDTLGHEAGDIVLKNVARRLQENIRTSDTVARVGGDEFVVILVDIVKNDDAGYIAGKIIASLSRPINASGKECVIGASIGISIYPEDSRTGEGMIKCADETMYRVKKMGRNNFLYFSK